MDTGDLLRRAITAARAGRKDEARHLLLQVVELEPHNETAWVWLSGLVDSLEDRIIACENVLTLNPGNDKVRRYLVELQRRQRPPAVEAILDDERLFDRAKAHLARSEPVIALELAHKTVQRNARHAAAWLMIADLSGDIDQKVTALEKASGINPGNAGTRARLAEARRFRDHPLEHAASLEAEGRFDEAIRVYSEQAARTNRPQDFDHVYDQITRLENLQKEKIRFVPPGSTILRLSFSWLCLYLVFIMLQAGLNPVRHPSWPLWIGLPLVAVGSFFIALAEVRSKHSVWQKFFAVQGTVSWTVRFIVSLVGWGLVIFPHVLLILDSLNRLNNFQIPPSPQF